MNEIDDLLGTDNNYNDRKYNNNNNWKAQNKIRNEAYKKINDMSFKVIKEGKLFTQYLNILSNFEKYSVANCLLILETEPNAIQIKSKQDWIYMGYATVENAKSIIILEPHKKDGKTYYNPKEEYDVSQTNAPIPKEKVYSNRQMLQALFKICKAEREPVDILPNGNKGAEYVESENKLYMCRGLKPEYLLKTVIQEIARMEMVGTENTEIKEFKTCCISYMICKKYGLDISQFNFSKLPVDITSKNKSIEIREELNDIRENFITLNTKIAKYFEELQKANKETER